MHIKYCIDDEEEDKKCLRIHGYIFSSDSESGKSDFDDEYELRKPPPLSWKVLEKSLVEITGDFQSQTSNVPLENIVKKLVIKTKELPLGRNFIKNGNIKPAEKNEQAHTNDGFDIDEEFTVKEVKKEEASDTDLEVSELTETVTIMKEPEKKDMNTFKKFGRVTNKEKLMKGKGKKKMYECRICNQSFKTVYSFKNHNIKHTGVKPFSCDFCNKGFLTKWAVMIHMRVHTGDKPLSCDVCQKNLG
ncbi:hypothetical protein NQ314_019565 [Rhamnusium bicolor]|uniref:C2H2-type domain-containing protein n=1 Tax=Rhamnusium bicolor TaxID=1586634 RepID=A0AAV8WNC4_9CUCU|nr:hypothetical protein NQ314_019565 [Rhamnusium bicolor]